MGMIVRLLVVAGLVFGIHYAVKHGVATAITAQLGDELEISPTITIDPEALRQAMELGRAVDTSALRAAIENASRELEEMNRTMRPPLPPMVPLPPNIPGLPRH